MSNINLNSVLSQLNQPKPKVQYKVHVDNTMPLQYQSIYTDAKQHNLKQKIQVILRTPHQPQKIQKPMSVVGFEKQLPKIERMPNEKLNMLNFHFSNKNIQNKVYQSRLNNFIEHAKKGRVLNAEFIKDGDKEYVLNQLKNYFYN